MDAVCTVLYADIVDSTRWGERLGATAAAKLWVRHDRESRTLARRCQATEVGRSDGFLLVLPTPEAALEFACAYHALLNRLHEGLQARIGLHCGEGRLRANSPEDTALGATRFELDGLVLPMVARVLSAAGPGQTLITRPFADALGSEAQACLSHGHWRLKGIAEPLELLEALHPLAPRVPPADSAKAHRVVRLGTDWVARADLPHNLPAERDTFIGRTAALQAIAACFEGGARLVTLTGTGGVGKTRAALRFARAWLGDYPGGVAWCDLTAARSTADVIATTGQSLHVPLGSNDPAVQLTRVLQRRGRLLLVLDNFEQVTHAAAETLGAWLDSAPAVHLLVTSRTVLGLPGEHLVALDSLPHAEAIELFAQRALASAPQQQAVLHDQSSVDGLVSLLDGLPLAIELAAARVRLAPPRELLQRMRDRFRLLSGPSARGDRQATLRGTFDWSWDLLDAGERVVLAQLSVFEGGFTLSAAEAVVAMPEGDSRWSLDLVQSLVDKSLVRSGDSGRLSLLQTVQEYAAEHLDAPRDRDVGWPGLREEAECRHAAYYAAAEDGTATAQATLEVRNFVAACVRRMRMADALGATRSLAGAWEGLLLVGPFRQAVELAEQCEAELELVGVSRMLVDGVKGAALCALGQPRDAAPLLQAAVEGARDQHHRAREVQYLCKLAEAGMALGTLDNAATVLQQASRAAAASNDMRLEVCVRNGMGSLALERGQLKHAQDHFTAALAAARHSGELRWEGGILSNLAVIAYAEGRLDDSERLLREALGLGQQAGDMGWQGSAQCNLGLLLLERGRADEAIPALQAAQRLARSLGRAQLDATVTCNLGLALEARDQLDEAAEELRSAVAMAQASGDRRSEGQFRGYQGRVLARLGDDDALACLDAGQVLLEAGDDELALGIFLACRAQAARALGRNDDRAQWLNRAIQIREAHRLGEGSELGRAIWNAER